MPAPLAADGEGGRGILEHWKDNMPVFNSWPRDRVPPKGIDKAFAARNHDQGRTAAKTGITRSVRWYCQGVPAAELKAVVEGVKKRSHRRPNPHSLIANPVARSRHAS